MGVYNIDTTRLVGSKFHGGTGTAASVQYDDYYSVLFVLHRFDRADLLPFEAPAAPKESLKGDHSGAIDKELGVVIAPAIRHPTGGSQQAESKGSRDKAHADEDQGIIEPTRALEKGRGGDCSEPYC